jgi:hypothetical protein
VSRQQERNKKYVWISSVNFSSRQFGLGDDSRFFALLGSAPQELNAVRPEAKLTC